ncbi:MAG TPA: YbhN family protein [Streptosporangiaceae bacterium]|nr:YbhN family protein [Streptosporangiaceae bacterium]
MLRRLLANPWLRLGFVVLVAGACTYGLVAEWSQAHAALAGMSWYPVIMAGLAAVVGSGCMLLAWRALLADLGSPLSKRAAARVMSVAQLGKYLPGAVWAFAAQVELAGDYEVPRRRCATTVITSVAVTLGIGLALAAVTLSLTSSAAAAHYWWALALAPVILIALYPPVLGRVIDRVMALIRRPPLGRWPTGRGIARAAAWTTAGWLAWGTQAWLLLRDLTGKGLGILLLSIGAYALAWCAGTMIVIFPGGIGPRELALIAALAPIAPRGPALVVAVLSRVLMTTSDLLWACAGLIIGRVMARSIQARHAAIQAEAEPAPYTPSYGSPPPGTPVPPAGQRPRTDLGCTPTPDPLPD